MHTLDGIVTENNLLGYHTKKMYSMLLWVCIVIDHRRGKS